MSDKAEKKPDAAPAAAAAPAKKDAAPAPAADAHGKSAGGKAGMMSMLTKTPVLLGGVMIIEAVVLFAGFKFLGAGAPKAAAGAEVATADEHSSSSSEHGEAGEHGEHGSTPAPIDKKKMVELEILSFRAPNKLSGKTFIYDVSIWADVRGANKEAVHTIIDERKNLITDRIRTIIAQTDPEKLGGGSEPGLETLRRQVKYQLDQIVGDGMIDEVLVPRCIPFRTDY